MKRSTRSYLALLCIIFSSCQQEDLEARMPVDCETKDCYEPPVRVVSERMIVWLENYYSQHASGSCKPYIGLIDATPPGYTYSCNLPHALLKGRVYFHGKAYYQLDLYYFIRPAWCGAPNGRPSYAGTIYVSRHTKRPISSGYYAGYSSFKAVTRPRMPALKVNGWYIHHFYQSESTYRHIKKFIGSGKWEGLRDEGDAASSCYTFR